MSKRKDGKRTTFVATINVIFWMCELAVIIIMKLEFWSMIESQCSCQSVFITMEVFCQVLVCVIYCPWVQLCVAVSGCLRLCVAVREVWRALKVWNEEVSKSHDLASNKDFILHGTSSFGVQLCGCSWKQWNMTILPNQVPETTYLILYWSVLEVMCLIILTHFMCIYIYIYIYLCFPYGL